MPKNEFSLPDPVAAFERRMQRLRKKALIDQEIDEVLERPPTPGEQSILGIGDTVAAAKRFIEKQDKERNRKGQEPT